MPRPIKPLPTSGPWGDGFDLGRPDRPVHLILTGGAPNLEVSLRTGDRGRFGERARPASLDATRPGTDGPLIAVRDRTPRWRRFADRLSVTVATWWEHLREEMAPGPRIRAAKTRRDRDSRRGGVSRTVTVDLPALDAGRSSHVAINLPPGSIVAAVMCGGKIDLSGDYRHVNVGAMKTAITVANASIGTASWSLDGGNAVITDASTEALNVTTTEGHVVIKSCKVSGTVSTGSGNVTMKRVESTDALVVTTPHGTVFSDQPVDTGQPGSSPPEKADQSGRVFVFAPEARVVIGGGPAPLRDFAPSPFAPPPPPPGAPWAHGFPSPSQVSLRGWARRNNDPTQRRGDGYGPR